MNFSIQPCFICKRQDSGQAVKRGGGLGWFCDECGGERAKKAAHMSHFNRLEQMAAEEAGNKGGAYLDSLDVTDLAKLTPKEYRLYVQTVIKAFGTEMRRLVDEEAPF